MEDRWPRCPMTPETWRRWLPTTCCCWGRDQFYPLASSRRKIHTPAGGGGRFSTWLTSSGGVGQESIFPCCRPDRSGRGPKGTSLWVMWFSLWMIPAVEVCGRSLEWQTLRRTRIWVEWLSTWIGAVLRLLHIRTAGRGFGPVTSRPQPRSQGLQKPWERGLSRRIRAAIIVGMEKYFSNHCFLKHFPYVWEYESKWEQAAILNGAGGWNSPTTLFWPSHSEAERLETAWSLYLFARNNGRVVHDDGTQVVIEACCFNHIGSMPFVRRVKFGIRDDVPLKRLRVVERQHFDDRGQVYVMINMYPIY